MSKRIFQEKLFTCIFSFIHKEYFNKCVRMVSIAAFGNPLLDIIVNIENNELLIKYNIKPDDQKEISDKDMNNLYKDIANFPRKVTAGGCAQNTLRVMQWILEKPNSVVFFGTIANDEQGKILRNLVNNDKVQTLYQVDEEHITGSTIALVSKDSRALFANISAANHYTKNELENDSESLDILKYARLIYIEACFLPNRLETAAFLENFCIQNNKVLVFNLSAAYLFEMEPETIQHFAKSCHILFGNKSEYHALGKLMKIDKVHNLAIELNKTFKDYDKTNCLMRFGKIVVVTNGSKSIKCIHSQGKIMEAKVRTVPEDMIVDTISAGDAFVGGFLVGLLKGHDIETCLDWGQKAASQIIMQPGCTIPNYSAKNIFSNNCRQMNLKI